MISLALDNGQTLCYHDRYEILVVDKLFTGANARFHTRLELPVQSVKVGDIIDEREVVAVTLT